MPRSTTDDETATRQYRWTLRLIRTLAAAGALLAVCFAVLTVRDFADNGWRDTIAGLASGAAGVAASVFFWRVDLARNITRTMQRMFGTVAAAAAVTVVAALASGSWTVALLLSLTLVIALTLIPLRSPGDRSDFGAIAARQGMDERRKRIETRAHASSHLIITAVAGAISLGSLLHNAYQGEMYVWPPALVVYAAGILLPLPLTWWHSSRM